MAPSAWILVLGVLTADGPGSTAALTGSKARGEAASALESMPPDSADQRDILLLLDGGPLHLRLHLMLDGVSLVEARRQYIERLIASLDGNHDGKLSRNEADGSPLLRIKKRAEASQFLESLGGPSSLSRRDVERTVDRLGGEPVAYRQDLSSSENDQEVFKL